ncbi:glycosyltransferase family 2 protein [uncultured Phycicoccus sp.]|uniref:glycosyltransferase family 2 protein n=1 Tax=uncultured Phycicoccus sp. TaxID=661422 RepID=UPI0026024E4F|nr:glycosyltransferase family 2 protein [uncultured Phycicoccus sp.]
MNEHPESAAAEADHDTLHAAPTERIGVPAASGTAEHPAAPTEAIEFRTGEMAGRSNDPSSTPRSETTRTSAGYVIEDGPDGPGPVPYVTVVLPCYNEGAHVLKEIDRLSAVLGESELTYELLCIDDASTDDTLAVLRGAQQRYPHIRVLPFRRNGGSGTARRIGTQQARGEIVVWTDADMTYENERIPELVRILREDLTYDQVVGARTTEEGTHKWARVPAKWFIRKVAEWLTKTRIPDLNSGLRAFRREVALPYLRLLPAGFSCVTTITIAFLSNQHDIKYVETSYAKRAGVSKFHFVNDAYRYILQVLRMVMYFDPLKVLMPPALWMIAIGFVKAVVDMVRHPFYFPASTVLLVVSGIMIASLALLSDLVVRSRDGV